MQHAEHLERGPRKSATIKDPLLRVSATLGAPQSHFAWQAQHLEHLGLITSASFCVAGAALGARRLNTIGAGCFCVAGATLGAPQSHFAWQAQHLEHLGFILRGRRSTWSTSACVAGAALEACQFRIAVVGQHHQHNTIYTTPSTQHHPHNIIHTTPSTLNHHILAGAALGALPSYLFCLIPADTPVVILRCGLFFVLFC